MWAAEYHIRRLGCGIRLTHTYSLHVSKEALASCLRPRVKPSFFMSQTPKTLLPPC